MSSPKKPKREKVLIRINPVINDWINNQSFGWQMSVFVRKIWMEHIEKEKKKNE